LYKTTGRQVFSDIDLRLLHDTEAGEGPVMYDVATRNRSGGRKTSCRTFGTSKMPGAGNVAVAKELVARRFHRRRRPARAIEGDRRR
jgi:hypothetical protein